MTNQQTSPVTFAIRDQLTGTETKAHVEHLRLAKLDEWELPEATNHHTARPTRSKVYVMPSESESDTDSLPEPNREFYTRQLRGEREDSSSEDDIPLMELKKMLPDRQRKKKEE